MGYELQDNALVEVKGKFYETASLDCDIHDEAYMKVLENLTKAFPTWKRKFCLSNGDSRSR